MTISVGAEHIEVGLPNDSQCCPVALAIKELVLKRVQVCDNGGIVLGEGDSLQFFTVPDLVAEWIDAFDAGFEVAPISFELTPDS